MEGMKNIFKTLIEAKLAAAPDSQAKTDLVEELADNLHCRYEDMVNDGVSQEEALVQAMDALGDVDELLDYLNNSQTEPGKDKKKAGSFTSDMGEMFRNIGDMVKDAMGQAKTAVSEVDWAGVANSAAESTRSAGRKMKLTLKELVKKAKENGGSWTGRSGDKTIHVTVEDDGKTSVNVVSDDAPEADGEPKVQIITEDGDTAPDVKITTDKNGNPKIKVTAGDETEKKDDGWKLGVTVEKNPEDGSEADSGDRAFYGVGYNKEKGGFYGRWGKEKEAEKVSVDGPVESAGLKGIDVQLVKGDVNITMDQEPDGDVLVGGEGLECLDVSVSEGGVLMIRLRREPSGFFGTTACDDRGVTLELQLPRRDWQFLRLNTVSGDIELNGDQTVNTLIVKTTSGDFSGALPACGSLEFNTISGDVNWAGDTAEIRGRTTSGDAELTGMLGKVAMNTISGDVRVAGSVMSFQFGSTSGDLELTSERLPEAIQVDTRSGDCDINIPDGGSFRVNYNLVSGDLHSDFFRRCPERHGELTYGEEGGPLYTFNTTGGDVGIYKY